MSSANYESSPGQILSSLQTVLSVSLLGSKTGHWRSNWRHLVPIVVPVLASQVVITDLAAPMLMAEPVSQQSVAGAVRYLMLQVGAGAATVNSAVCLHDPDRLHPCQVAAVGMASRVHNPHR